MKCFKYILLACLSIVGAHALAQEVSPTRELLYTVNSLWRSSSVNIDEKTIREEMIGSHPPRFDEHILRALSAVDMSDLIAELENAAQEKDQRLLVNKEMAGNIIKMKIVADHITRFRSAAPHNDFEIIAGYTPAALSNLVRNLPKVEKSNKVSGEFDYHDALFERELAHNNIFKNDLYVFKIAYALWKRGLVPGVKLVSEVMIRGNGEMGLLTAVGQDDFVRGLRAARFQPRQIEYLKTVKGFEHAEPEFFEALLKWRFKGDVWLRKTSLITPGSSYALLIGDFFDVLFAEAPSLANIAVAVGTGTLASRLVRAAKWRPLVEGGTRRLLEGFLRAKYAVIAGFVGTSNVEAAHIMGLEPMGSGGNHAAVGSIAALEGDEMDFHLAMQNVFDWKPLRYLADTFNMKMGIRKILRATRGDAGGARSDSDIPGKTTSETLFEIAEVFSEVGYENADRPQISHTNDVNEYTLEKLDADGAPVDSALVGGRLSHAPNLSPVMKAVAVIGLDGKMHPVSKTADPGKSHYPMPKMWGRKTENGKYVGDTAVVLGEELPEGYEPQLDQYLKSGELIKGLPTIAEQKAALATDEKMMPEEALSIHAKPGIYPATYSAQLEKIRNDYVDEHNPASHERVGIYPGSFDGTHESHVAVARRFKALYGLDRVIIVPTGNASIKSAGYRSKLYRLTAAARVAMLRRKFKDLPWITIYEGESSSPVPLTTYQNVQAIEKLLTKGSEIFVILGQDLMTAIAHFANSKELLENYNVIIAERKADETQSVSTFQHPAELAQAAGTNHILREGSVDLLRTPKDEAGHFNVMELQPLRNAEPHSSSALRAFYDGSKILFSVHATNTRQEKPLPNMDRIAMSSSEIPGVRQTYGPLDLASLEKIDPYKVLPNFHFGWDLDREMKDLVLEETKNGYDTYVIIDSSAGNHARQSATALREMAGAGVKFISTKEYFDLLKIAGANGADWAKVLNFLAELKARSVTQPTVLDELNNNFFWASDAVNDCVMTLENAGKKL